MSTDRSLRVQSSLVRHRNVLSRAERIAVLMERGWDPSKGALHLPKVAHRKVKAGKKKSGKQEAAATEQASS